MNAGRVELDLVAVGKDQVSAMLKQVEARANAAAKELGGTAEAANKAGGGIASLGNAATGLKDKAGGINKIKEAFENLRGNGVFALTAIVGAVELVSSGIKFLGDAMTTASAASKKWQVAQAGLAETTKQTTTLVDALSASLDELQKKAPKLKVDVQYDDAEKQLNKLRNDMVAGGVVAKELGEDLKLLQVSPVGFFAANEVLGEIKKTQEDINTLKRQEHDLTVLTAEVDRERVIAMRRDLRPLLEFLGQKKPGKAVEGWWLPTELNSSDPLLRVDQPKDAKKGWAGARAKPMTEAELREAMLDAIRGTGKWAAKDGKDDLSKILDGVESDVSPLDAWLVDMQKRADAQPKDTTEALSKMRTDAGALADELMRVADATQLVATVMPEMGAALDEVQAKIADGKLNLAEALAQGATAIAANAAKAIGGVRAEAAVRAAYEIGMGFATLATPVISAGHFTAGAMLGAVALGAGGGGAKGSGSGGGSAGYMPDSARQGGAGTTVWNISTLVTDPHTLQRATASSSRATAGTGIGERSAA